MRAVLILLVALAGCARDDGCRLERLAVLPVRMLGKVPLVPVEINGRAAELVLDTGANATLLGRAAARRLGVAEGPERERTVGAGGVGAVSVGRVDSLSLGAVRTGGARVLVTDNLGGVDGLLGVDALLDFEVEMDLPRQRVTLWKARSCAVGRPGWTGAYTELASQPSRAGPLYIPVTVNGQGLRGMLDTGASRTILSLQSAEDTGLRGKALAALPAQRGLSVNPGGLVSRQAEFQMLRIGDETVERPVLMVGDLPAVAGDLLVGEDYLGSRRVWLWFRLGRVFVAPAVGPDGTLDSVPPAPL